MKVCVLVDGVKAAGVAAAESAIVLLGVEFGHLAGRVVDSSGMWPRGRCGSRSRNSSKGRMCYRASILVTWVAESSARLVRNLGAGVCC